MTINKNKSNVKRQTKKYEANSFKQVNPYEVWPILSGHVQDEC